MNCDKTKLGYILKNLSKTNIVYKGTGKSKLNITSI